MVLSKQIKVTGTQTTGKPSFASNMWALGAVVYQIVSRGDHSSQMPETTEMSVLMSILI